MTEYITDKQKRHKDIVFCKHGLNTKYPCGVCAREKEEKKPKKPKKKAI